MAMRRCAGDCGRMISISAIPGGNPTALADPRNWAVDYAACTTCRTMLCDRCVTALGAAVCPADGGTLRQVRVSPPPAVPAVSGPPSEPRSRWWKPGRS